MDGWVGGSVTNLVSLLHNVKFFDTKFKSHVCMHGFTSKKIITSCAVEYMRVHALTIHGYLDATCYYSPHYSTTLLSQVSAFKATSHPKQYIFLECNYLFGFNKRSTGSRLNVKLRQLGKFWLQSQSQYLCAHSCSSPKHSSSVSVPEIIWSYLCYAHL